MSWAAELLAVVGNGEGEVVVDPPGAGDGYWAGAPSVITVEDGLWLAYRLRRPVGRGRGYANVIAHSTDGVRFETVATVTSEQFDSDSLERPALVPLPQGGWRLYVSCASHNTKHWWVEAIEAPTPAKLPEGKRTVVLPGDETTAWKDIVIHPPLETAAHDFWQMWACRHPLDRGDDEADRMVTHYLTSHDGLTWTDEGPALLPTPDTWDARGARITSVLHDADARNPGNDGTASGGRWLAFYDGRASAAENWHERAGLAAGERPASFTAIAGPTPTGQTARYLSVARVNGGVRLYWEASRSDGSNDLRTAYVPRPLSPNQS
jgi:hypothetical protein